MQDRLWQAVETEGVRLIGFGGGIRGTKTWGSLATILALARIYPRSRWHIVRKDLERLKDSTIPSFEKLAERFGDFVGRLNRAEWYAVCRNGSEIHFVGESIDRDPDLSRFHGFETNGFLLDDGDELAERTFIKCIERAGTWIVPSGSQPPPYVLATFNPCAGWPRRRFYAPWKAGQLRAPYAFIPSTAADNPYISAEQRQAWEEMPDAEYKRFVVGDWETLTGAYYDTLDPAVHLIDRAALPDPLPEYWARWSSFDWGYAHWAVMGAWATDPDGTDYLLDAVWVRRMQDDEMARAFRAELPADCLAECYAGHDTFNKVRARTASGESTADIFAQHGIRCVRADPDPVNRGRAVNRQLKVTNGRARCYFVRTPGTLRVFDQLGEIVPDPNDVRRPLKVDADQNGLGGDDGADMVSHGIATRHRVHVPGRLPDLKLPDQAIPLEGRIKDGHLVPAEKRARSLAEVVDRLQAKRHRSDGRVPFTRHLP